MPLATYQAFVASLVRDDAARITPEDRDAAIGQAASTLSKYKPRELVVEMTNVAGARVAAPAGWAIGESRLANIEYPVGETPPAYLEGATVYDKPDGSQELALASPLPAASTVRVSFTAPHQVTGQRDTVPAADQWGVVALAASILCGQLASIYANQTDTTIAADGVDHKSKSELYAAREREYRNQAYASWGIPLPSTKAAAATTQPAGTVVSFEPRRPVRRLVW